MAPSAATDEHHPTDEAERRKQAMSTAGLSKARLSRMHDVMAGYVERGEVPGLVTLVSRRGEVHGDVIGTQALGESPPMRRDTIFFTLYALKTEKLALPEKVSLETFTEAVEQNSLATAKLVGTFTKVKTK